MTETHSNLFISFQINTGKLKQFLVNRAPALVATSPQLHIDQQRRPLKIGSFVEINNRA